jgi:hypothetical protein
LRIHSLEVIEQPPTPTDKHQQTPATGEILLVRPQVLREPVDPRREDGDLHFRGARIVFAALELPDQLLFPLSRNGHLLPQFLESGRLLMLHAEADSSHRLY